MKYPEIKGYKGFKFNLEHGLFCCPRNNKIKTFNVREVALQKGEILLCKNGIHFCKKLLSVFQFYNFGSNIFFARVTAIGKTESDGIKSVTSKLLVNELMSLVDIFKFKKRVLLKTGKKRFYFKELKSCQFLKEKINYANFYFEDADVYKYYLEQKLKTNRITLSYYIYKNSPSIILTNKKIKNA